MTRILLPSDPMLPACLGGWCHRREECPQYHAEDRRAPVERLCIRRRDGQLDGYRTVTHRKAGEWEAIRLHTRAATPFDALLEASA